MELILVQYDIQWENPDANFEIVREQLESAPLTPGSLIVLPEMFATGFSMNVEKVTAHAAAAEDFLRELAARYQSTLVGGIASPAAGSGLGKNEMVVMAPDGTRIACYQKIHTFSYGGETDCYQRGTELKQFDWAGFKVCPLICYDLRFPELCRQAVNQGTDMFLYIANWPSPRIDHWTTLLKARAIENQAIVAGLNRTGSDPQHAYSGQSRIFDHQGKTLMAADFESTVIKSVPDLQSLQAWRSEFPALKDAYLA